MCPLRHGQTAVVVGGGRRTTILEERSVERSARLSGLSERHAAQLVATGTCSCTLENSHACAINTDADVKDSKQLPETTATSKSPTPPSMENEKIADFLQQQRDEAAEDVQHYFLSFEDYWERKLWHELTDILVAYYNDNESKPQRLAIYNHFIKPFADKINQLKLVRIGLSTANTCSSRSSSTASTSALLMYRLLVQTTKSALTSF